MLDDRKVEVPALVMEIPSHKGGSKPSNREVRDANAPASPQPQQNVGQHYPRHHPPHQPPHLHQAPYPYAHTQHPQHPQSQSQQQPHQQHKGHSTHPRRGSTDRGGGPKDSPKSKSSTPKPAPEHVGPYSLGKTLGKGSSGTEHHDLLVTLFIFVLVEQVMFFIPFFPYFSRIIIHARIAWHHTFASFPYPSLAPPSPFRTYPSSVSPHTRLQVLVRW